MRLHFYLHLWKPIVFIKKGLLPLLLFFTIMAVAQVFPVQVSHNLVPPYSSKIGDYATGLGTKLQLRLLLTDIGESNRQVGLRLNINGNGINVRSAQVVVGAPAIFLNGGVLQQFTNVELAPYFELANLEGIGPREYARPLPDGVYRICWEVYDHFTGRPISRNSCTTAYLLLNDPPLPNIPVRGERVADRGIPNIIFQWTPRHVNAINVSYEFELRELWDDGMDPQAAFLASPNYHSETTFATTLHYAIGRPVLYPGRTYGWRVRAVSTTGLAENAVFKNNGHSEIYHFTMARDCDPPLFPLSEARGPKSVKITWQDSPDHGAYHLQYRRTGVEGAHWFEVHTKNDRATLQGLSPGAEYEFRIGGSCDPPTELAPAYTYGSITRFTMPTEEGSTGYNCGFVPRVEITDTEPLDHIGINEVFTAGDFPVTVKEVVMNDGRFTGWGYIIVPYLADTRLRVSFKNIRINTEGQLIAGKVTTDYDPQWANVESVEGFVDGLGEVIDTLSDQLEAIVSLLKEKMELDQQVDASIRILQDNLEDPDNGLTEEQENNIRQFISDRKKVEEAIIREKEKIANGERDELIKQNLASQLVDEVQNPSEEEISDVVDIDGLIAFIKKNVEAGNDRADYNKGDFHKRTVLLEDHRMDYTARDGTKIGLYVNLNGSGTIDLALGPNGTYNGVNLKIDTDDLFHTGFYLNFDYGNEEGTAIEIWTKSFEGYSALLQTFGFKFDDTYALSVYERAIAGAGNDCDDLDVIYETIPPKVAKKLGDRQLYKDLKLLVECNISSLPRLYDGTDENLAVINIMNAFDEKYIYGKIVSDPSMYIGLFDRIDPKYIAGYIRSLTKIGLANWTRPEIDQSLPFPLVPIHHYSVLDPQRLDVKIVGLCGHNKTENNYEVGYTAHRYGPGPSTEPVSSRYKKLGTVRPFAPVHAKWEGDDILLPAMAAGHFTDEAVAETTGIVLNNIAEVLLPEFTRLGLKSLSWLDDLGRAGDEFLEEIISSIPASQRNLYHTNAGRFAPYNETFNVFLVKLNPIEDYVRVYKKSVDENGVILSNKVSYWFMRKKDITKADGSIMTPLEIKNKYALPEAPSHYTNVNLPSDKRVYRGVVKEQTQHGWGNGGGIQFELNETPQSFWFSGEIGL
ncbi:fibronectin type III domain-containing protein [Spongiimicrobium sp. 3-5]|uniref:fibronectin type III domain-containing protein n=1 Tax=Spongiimicrobium sp. 3-5 TaxID=3332596 RepID=UPI0039807375